PPETNPPACPQWKVALVSLKFSSEICKVLEGKQPESRKFRYHKYVFYQAISMGKRFFRTDYFR
ncbi:MAG: hypothetical protein KKA60_06230, partial [Proteobacteria bacterium]|nr:hypothetical protein [Pseudomonadota bacterium]